MSDEAAVLTRARELAEDVEELGEAVTAILGRARAARVDPDALGGLTGAAIALGQDRTAVYRAGPPEHKPHRADAEFLSELAEAAEDAGELLAQAAQLEREAQQALDVALAALAAARAMPARTEDEAAARAEAIRAAAERVSLARAAQRLACQLAQNLGHALRRLEAVPEDLGDTYRAAYDLIRRGGQLPADGDWLTGEDGAVPVLP
jgi:hypothetical protein